MTFLYKEGLKWRLLEMSNKELERYRILLEINIQGNFNYARGLTFTVLRQCATKG